MKIFLRIFFIFCFLLGLSLPLLTAPKSQAYVDYINQYSGLAIDHRIRYNIPASIILAQGILESGAGNSDLATTANNHFGIKCHSTWTGERVYRRDDTPNDCFRKYNRVEDSYEDHSKFLQQSRYAILFTYDIWDYTSWAIGLQNCGYATDKGYANKLIKIIEDYALYEYDRVVPWRNTPSQDKNNQTKLKAEPRDIYKAYNLLYVIAKEGDSFAQIAKDTGFKEKNLIKYNEVPADFPLKDGDIVFLEKKKDRADRPYYEHVVRVGESMYSISQWYGIRVESLYKMNKKNSDYIPFEGDILRLR